MAHEETIRIYRSNVPGAEPPSLTYGELAANLADRKVFVGGPGGTADMIVLLETPEATGLPLATTGASGVASFFGGDFTVSTTGHVFLSRDFIDIYSGDGIDVIGGGGKVSLGESITIRNVGVTSFNGATGSISLFDFVQGEGIATRSQGNKIILTNIGVTGISAGHTGISLNGTTGSLQIFNMGVLSVDGQTGHIDLGSIIGETGDTVLAGLAIGVARNNNQVTINNLGVTSFNGQTGAVTYSVPLATNGLSGVASFQLGQFSVSNTGHVSLASDSINLDPRSGIAVSPDKVSLGGTLTVYNTGVTSFNGATGSISLFDFVEGGEGILLGSKAAGTVLTITNLGVTSFNGQTGGVQYSPPIATHSVTGVAFFPPADFQISNGSVSLTGNVARTTVQNTFSPTQILLGGLVSSAGITSTGAIVTTSASGFSGASISTATVIHPVGGLTIKPPGTPIGTGAIKLYGSSDLGVVSYATIDSGAISDNRTISLPDASGTIALTNSVVTSFNGTVGAATLTGDGGAIRGAGNNAITARLADTSVTGVAFFDSAHFTVDTGRVSLKTAYTITGNTVLAGSGIAIPPSADNTKTIVNIGVTGISAGHTGIALSGTTGNVQIFNMGVLSVNGYTGHVNLDEILIEGATGDTVLAGSGIAIPASGDNTKTIINVGVTGILQDDRTLTGAVRFNSGKGITFSYGSGGLTFANTGVLTINSLTPDESGNFDIQAATVVTGDGGALVGDGVRILARLATSSLTGVASFPTADFGVVDGSVSLTGNVARTNLQNVFSATQILSAGLSASGGITSNGTIVTTNSAGFSGPTLNTAKVTHPSTGLVVEPFGSGVGTIKFTDKFGGNSLSISPNSLSLDRTISFPDASGTVALTNAVVTSLNGNVGALTITGDGAAIRGVGNNIIGTRLADTDVTGVAFFDSAHFTVNTGRVSLKTAYTITGDTVLSGVAIGVARNSNEVRINNLGVTSFNGLTGAVTLTGDGGAIVGRSNNTIGARLATTGVTGVASYNPFHFGVVNGEVSLHPSYQATGDTVTVSAPLTISRTLNDVRLGIGAAGNGVSGVASFDSTNFNVTTTGHVSFVGNVFSIRDERGTSENVSKNSTITITGGQGIDFLWTSKDNFAIRGVTASTTAVGVASYNPSQFTVNSSAQVSLASLYATVGVTGISAGHTGIALSGTTGNVQIFNMGVHTFNGATGHITFNPATGDTITSGLAIGVSVVSGNNKRIDNLGVTSFNGLTGAVTLTGDGGAVIGRGNNTITARIATSGATGVASFPAAFFAVNNGAVSLSGPYGVIGVTGIAISDTDGGITGRVVITGGTNVSITKDGNRITISSNDGATGNTVLAGSGIAIPTPVDNTRTIINIGVTGISAGHTGIALSGTTGNVQIFNMGILSINGQTGHYTLPAAGATGDTVTAGLAIGVSVVSGNQKRIDNLGVTSFNGLTGAVTLTGDGGAVIGVGNNRIIARLVTSGTTGIASFNTDHFSVSSSTGHVSLASAYTATGDTVITVPGSGIGISTNGRTDTLFNIGVTGISAGHTGIALSGTTGNVQIWNMGVLSLDGQTGHLSRGATGDTVVAGVGVSVVRSGNQVTVNNMGVTSFNGLTGAVVGVSSVNGFASGVTFNAGTGLALNSSSGSLTFANLWGAIDTALKQENKVIVAGAGTQPHQYASIQELIGAYVFRVNGLTGNVSITGDGGAIVGVNNNTIRARLAVGGATGVASFNSGDFNVSNTGHVSVTRRTLLTLDDVDDALIDDGKFLVYNGSVFEFKTVSDIYSPPIGVTSFNGLTGAVTLTGDGGAIVGTGNNRIIARLVTSGTTGIASFNTTHFSVSSSTGHVSLASAYTATGDTVTAGLAIGVSVVSGNNKRIDNLGVTSFNGLTGTVTLTGDSGAIIGRGNNTITARVTTSAGATGVASFNTTHFSVSSSTGHVSLASAYTVTGDTVRGDNGAITVGNPSGRLKDVTVRVALVSADPIEAGTTGVAAFFQDHFTVTDGLVKLAADGGGGDCGGLCPQLNSGLGASAAPDGSLSYLYLDIGNLSAAPSAAWDASRDQLIIYDGAESSLVKTKKTPFKTFFLNNAISDLFNTNTSGQIEKTKSGDAILYNIKTGNIGAGQEGLIKGSTAFAYIAQNSIASLNGLTGARTLTGDGGAIVGSSNTTIGARLATASLTGVASFPTADFGVVNGAVSLTGNVARTGNANTFTSTNTFSATNQFTNTILGLSAANASFSVIRGAGSAIIVRAENTAVQPNKGSLRFESDDGEGGVYYSTVIPTILSGNKTITLPDDTGTVALRNTAQTFSETQTFSTGITSANLWVSAGATFADSLDMKRSSEVVNAVTSARTVTFSFANGNVQTFTGSGSGATGAAAISVSGAPASGRAGSMTVIITNGGLMTGNTAFWSSAIKWPGGNKPTLSSSGVDVVTFVTTDGGTTVYGFLGGLNFS